jgi:serine/threonine-protein kinase RsbW
MKRNLRIESKISSIRAVERAIDEATSELDISQDCYGKILVSTLEAVNNAIIHGNKLDPGKFVDIEIFNENDVIKIKISDQGNGFSPDKVPDPTIPENLQEINGRGVFLMSRLADRIEYNNLGNEVTMTFLILVS